MTQVIIDNQLEQRWASCRDGQILVDATHPLKMYLSVSEDENKQLLVPTPRKINRIKSSSAIKITNGISGKQNYLIVELANPLLTKEFMFLCVDLIEKSRTYLSADESLKSLIDSFINWQQLFDATNHELLSVIEIKGLIGEVLFIQSELQQDKSAGSVVGAWKTHKDSARDFVYDDNWFEIKSVSSTSDYVTISSIEQLDHIKEGELVVYFLDKKQNSAEDAITLPQVIASTETLLTGSTYLGEFRKKLLSKGYIYHQEYDDVFFSVMGCNRYIVNESFPKIERSFLAEQILGAKYEISLCGLTNWLIGG